MTTLGAVFVPFHAPEQLRPVALAAEESGLDELWLWEDCFREGGISTAAAALAWTERIRVGVGLLPVPLRNVALTAMELASLHRMFPGRPLVGIGHGVQSWMGQVGVRVESPLTLLREYTLALRALLDGEEVTASGRYVQLDGVRLDWPPQQPVPVLAGALGPKSLRLCGEVADGTIVAGGSTVEEVRSSIGHVRNGQRASGRTSHHPITAYLLTTTGPDAEDRLAAEIAREGFEPGAEVGVAGDAAAVAAAVRRWTEAGADSVVLQPASDEPDPEGFVRFVGDEVRPLLG